jgi:formate dehydrogenase subunit delta
MNQDTLIDMANRIGDFFASMPDRDEALHGIADHIRKYWEPRMRRQIMASLDTSGSAEMTPIVRAALQGNRAALTPAADVPTSTPH